MERWCAFLPDVTNVSKAEAQGTIITGNPKTQHKRCNVQYVSDQIMYQVRASC